ncbi:MAG: SRPBCC family protein [Candidatus Promineifilaceae bacterium]|nr:SRPBCC family protein [Candidatus Promineifilaceae bacterium]
MTAQVQQEQVIDRPVDVVFDFVARRHVQNHPRWDPEMELEQLTEGPLGVGTIIRRRRPGHPTQPDAGPIEGTMEVVEFEPNQALGLVIRDGPVEIRSRTTYEALDDQRTLLTGHVEISGMDESADTGPMANALKRSMRRIKQLVESEH